MIPWKLKTLVDEGSTTIGDIIDENGNIQNIADLHSYWNITCGFLLHSEEKD